MTPHGKWFNRDTTSLQHLYIFGQVGYVPVMDKAVSKKHNKRGRLVRYLRRDGPNHLWVETTDGDVKRFRGSAFHPYFADRDPAQTLHKATTQGHFADKQRKAGDERSSETDLTLTVGHNKEQMEMTVNAEKYKQPIPREITWTTPNPASRSHALRYLDTHLLGKRIHFELEKIDETGTVK